MKLMEDLNDFNSTSNCFANLPSAKELLSALELEQKAIFIVPITFAILTFLVYLSNLTNVLKNNSKLTKGNVTSLITIYPIVALSSLVSIILPKSSFFCDTISHISFVLISYQFYRYCLNCVEGESRFIAISKDETFSLQAPPCCCCFACFRRSSITKRKFKILRFLVLQFPIIHIFIFISLNIIAFESPNFIEQIFPFLGPFLLTTILLGVWAFQITIRMISPYYENLNLLKKFLAFQLVIILTKVQPLISGFIVKYLITHDCPENSSNIFIINHSIVQIAIQLEMFVLSTWAHKLYKS